PSAWPSASASSSVDASWRRARWRSCASRRERERRSRISSLRSRVRKRVRLAARAPGWRWLLAHELRLSWRAQGGKGVWFLLAVLTIFLAFGHVAAWFAMRDPSRLVAGGAIVTGGVATWFVVLLIVATAFGLSIVALFERNDLDLLLSSPIPP